MSENREPLVTVALFAYNQEAYIHEALDSILSQTYEPLEIIITDDCSQDGTFESIEHLIHNYQGPHKILVQRNASNLGKNKWGENVNNAVQVAQGELIVLAAGDDISLPNRVTELVDKWKSCGKPSGVVHSAYITLSDNTRLSGATRQEGIVFGSLSLLEVIRNDGEGILGATMAFTKDLFTRFGPLPPNTAFEDCVLGFRAVLSGKVLFLNEPLVRYRIHDGNVSGPSIYADAARWDRFRRGHQALFAAFRQDYLNENPVATADPRVLSMIDSRLRHILRTEKLVTGTAIERALAAYHVSSKQKRWRYRASFILKISGLERFKLASLLRHFVRRLLTQASSGQQRR